MNEKIFNNLKRWRLIHALKSMQFYLISIDEKGPITMGVPFLGIYQIYTLNKG